MLFTAYSIVRTVPSTNRPNRRKKKRLWPGSSSTLTGDKWIENHPTLKKLMYDNTAEAAHKAVREQ